MMTIGWTDERLGNGSLVVMQGKLFSHFVTTKLMNLGRTQEYWKVRQIYFQGAEH
jgi:hypothetical protein